MKLPKEAQEMRSHRHLAIVVLVVLLVACAPAATPTPTPTPTPLPTPAPLPYVKVSVGTHELAYRCSGTGSPTVVIEAGYGGAPVTTHDWDAVVKGVEPVSRICLYDRAPWGMSYSVIRVHTCEQAADDLHSLLQSAQIEGPYVLVGFSLGGWFVRYYATKYLNELAGMVLVDATPPNGAARELALLPPESPGEAESLTNERTQLVDWYNSTGNNFEGLNIVAASEQAAKLTSLGDMPLVVLSHSPTTFDWGLSADLNTKLEQVFQDSQVEQSKLSTNSSLVVATTAGHDIEVDEPQLVIDAILKVVEEARKRAQ
jgi:pimeloyl-ACP methyl ester carboxylesterase